MGTHTAERKPASSVLKAVSWGVSLAVVGGVLQLTSALWSDQVPVSGDVSSASFGLEVNGSSSVELGSLLEGLAPDGELRSTAFEITNTGSVPGQLQLEVDNGGATSPLPDQIVLAVAEGTEPSPESLRYMGTMGEGFKLLEMHDDSATEGDPVPPLPPLEPGQTLLLTAFFAMQDTSDLVFAGESFSTSLVFTLTQADAELPPVVVAN